MFLWGAVIGHFHQWFAHGDHAPGNGGGVLVCDVLFPAVVIVLARRSRRPAASPGKSGHDRAGRTKMAPETTPGSSA